jgi:hypothetical protein
LSPSLLAWGEAPRVRPRGYPLVLLLTPVKLLERGFDASLDPRERPSELVLGALFGVERLGLAAIDGHPLA